MMNLEQTTIYIRFFEMQSNNDRQIKLYKGEHTGTQMLCQVNYACCLAVEA